MTPLKIYKTLNTMVDNGRSKIDKTSGYNGLRHVKKREARFDPSALLERLKLYEVSKYNIHKL